MEEPFDCVEDMAQYYVEGLNELQPCGPYILIGYSFGGLVALEMAQRLSDSGEPTVVEAELTRPDDVVLSKGTIENNLLRLNHTGGRRGNLRQKDMTGYDRRSAS
jgi:pimeloyl-ACP methyl ester carboxylesterase